MVPLVCFVVVGFLAVTLSVSNLDNRAEIQTVGLAVCAVIAIDAIRRGAIRFAEGRAHAIAALGVALGILTFVVVSVVQSARTSNRASNASAAPQPRAFESTFQSRRPVDVWIDTDPSCGLGPDADVDDCWALLAALRSPRLRVLGISTVFGNTDGDAAYDKALEVVRIAEGATAVEVWKGALRHGGEDWTPTDGSQALVRALERTRLTIIAIGPLTNIATALARRPDLRNRIDRIVFVGGRRPGRLFHPGRQWWFHFRDLNVCGDPAAAEKVLYSGIPITLIPFELAEKVTIGEPELQRLSGGDGAARWLSTTSRPWATYWQDRLGRNGFYPFDFLAVGYLHSPDAFGCRLLPSRIGFQAFLQAAGMGRDFEVAAGIRGPLVEYCTGVTDDAKSAMIGEMLSAAHVGG